MRSEGQHNKLLWKEEIKGRVKRKQIKDIFGLLFLTAGLFLIGEMASLCFSADIWYDEVFSVKMLSGSYREIAHFTANDVHPPFYYWYLKFFVQVGSLLAGPLTKESIVILAKLASLLPMAGLWGLAAVKLRKQFGLFTAGVFIFCVYTMPQLTAYGMEIRMYALALFMVTCSFFFAYDIYVTRKNQAFIGLFLCGILVAYTHYFSCLGIGFLYLLLGLIIRKDKVAVKKWLLCIGASVLAYLPWLGTLLRQFLQVKGSYWIPPLTWKSFGGCVKYIFLPSGGYPKINYLLAALLFLALLGMGAVFWKKGIKTGNLLNREGAALWLSWGMLGGVILVGVGVSILISPVFVYRYMIPFLGSFWFAFALLLDGSDKRLCRILVCMLALTMGFMNVKGVFWEEKNKTEQMKTTIQGLAKVEKEDILIFNFDHVQAVVGYYKDNESYLLYGEPEPLMKELYGNLGMLEETDQIEELLNKQTKGRVWFLGSFNAREEIVEQWKDMGLTVTQEGSYLLERYWFNLYRIEKGL